MVAFVAYSLYQLDYQSLAEIELATVPLVFGLIVGVSHRFLQPLVWWLMLRSLRFRVRGLREYNLVYARGWLSRYLPGKVGTIAVRAYFADRLGIDRGAATATTIAELASQLLVACICGLIGVAFIPAHLPILDRFAPLVWTAVAFLSLLLVPVIFNRLIAFGLRLLRRPGPVARLHTPTIVSAVAGHTVLTVVVGTQYVLMAAAVDPIAYTQPVFLWGAHHLAIAIGILVFVAPAGIGARDGVYLAMLSLWFEPHTAAAVVVLSRLVDSAADLVYYGLSLVIARWPSRKPQPEG